MNAQLVGHLQGFFQTYLRDQRAVSPNTIKSYRDTFKQLIHYANQHRGGRVLAVKDLDAKTILAFLQYVEDPSNGRGNCAFTRNLRLAAIQSFFRYLSIHYPNLERQCRTIFAVPRKRAADREPQSLSRKEMGVLLAQPRTDDIDGLRDLAILTFIYNTGARAQEAADAHWSWFDFPNRTVKIIGKGRKERLTPLRPSMVELLERYWKNYRRKPDSAAAGYLFINQRGSRFTRFGIRTIVKKYLRLAVKTCPSLAAKRLSTHSLRHTTACHLLESRVGPIGIKAWLGHASIKTTSRYFHADLSHKRQILEQFGPQDYVASALQPQQGDPPEKIIDWLSQL